MSPIGIASTLLGLIQSSWSSSSQTNQGTALAGSSESADFSSSLTLRMAALQAQSVNSLLGSVSSGKSASSSFDFLTGSQSGTTGVQGLSGSGRNLSLFDPESGYEMMSVINTKDVTYKAQFSELSEMKKPICGELSPKRCASSPSWA